MSCSNVRVKICGITTVEDALAAVDAGADAIGLNFVGGPRQLAVGQATEILGALPPLVTPIALVRLEGGQVPDPLLEVLGQYWVSHVQLYGAVAREDLALLLRDGFKAMPAVAVADEHFVDAVGRWLPANSTVAPAAIVLDAHDPAREGGTGLPFQWEWIPSARKAGKLDHWPPIILAGGLNPVNVAEAVRTVRPYGVDVSSGVEMRGSPGRKDPAKMREFVCRAREAALRWEPLV
ncbi:MAG: phosphoribosylanthranilate isomerase [Phycisphaerae bacterium]|nr:phosphoribosylanthranilate isomerase [Phycisphaerae bacterium]